MVQTGRVRASTWPGAGALGAEQVQQVGGDGHAHRRAAAHQARAIAAAAVTAAQAARAAAVVRLHRCQASSASAQQLAIRQDQQVQGPKSWAAGAVFPVANSGDVC